MMSVLRTVINQLHIILPKCTLINQNSRLFHLLSKPNTISVSTVHENQLLKPVLPVMIPNCGFKVKGRLRRRCKDCYFVMRQERLYVICKTHPRHKQMSMIPKEKNTWILSAATQGKIRPW